MQHVLTWHRPVLIGFTLWLALCSALAWGGEQWVDRNTVHFDVVLMPGHRLHVHLGNRFMQRYYGTFPEPSAHRRIFAPIHVGVWYRTGGTLFGRQLLVLALPTWPLVALTALFGCSVLILSLMRQSDTAR